MKYEDIKIGDVLLIEGKDWDLEGKGLNEPIKYFLVVWKYDRDKEIGCRVGLKRDKSIYNGYKIDIGQDIIVDVKAIRNFTLSESQGGIKDVFNESDRKRVDAASKIMHLTEEQISLFDIIDQYASSYNTVMNQTVIKLEDMDDNVKRKLNSVVSYNKKYAEARKKYFDERDKFVSEVYPYLMEKGRPNRMFDC